MGGRYSAGVVSAVYDQYREFRYFPGLDGVRALAVLAVITVHVGDNSVYGAWAWLGGESGVALFFVLSGFLITTLALREESERGSLSLKAFYIRRTLRIFPAYYYVLGLSVLLCATVGGGLWSDMKEALPYYLLYLGEYAPGAHFYHSWSLGIEEKFYLVWPPVCFILLRGQKGLRFAAAGLLSLAPVVIPISWGGYPRIMAGCVLALALHEPAVYRMLRRALVGWLAPALLVGGHALAYAGEIRPGWQQPVYTLTILYFFAVLLVRRPVWVRLLEWAPLRYIGRRSYGIYLVQLLAIPIGTFLPLGSGLWWIETANVISSTLVAIVAAEILYRVIEKVPQQWGQKTSRRVLERISLAPQTERA